MDSITRILARHSLGLRFEDLPERIVTRTKQAVLDSLGCAVAGYTSESSRIVQDTMKTWPGEPGASARALFRSLALTQLGEGRTQELIRLVSTLQEQSSPQRLMELLAWDKY